MCKRELEVTLKHIMNAMFPPNCLYYSEAKPQNILEYHSRIRGSRPIHYVWHSHLLGLCRTGIIPVQNCISPHNNSAVHWITSINSIIPTAPLFLKDAPLKACQFSVCWSFSQPGSIHHPAKSGPNPADKIKFWLMSVPRTLLTPHFPHWSPITPLWQSPRWDKNWYSHKGSLL